MLNLPVCHSVISSEALPSAISELYDARIIECHFLSNGLNDTYKLHTETEKYILRIYKSHWRSRNDILFELELLKDLKEKAIPVSAPVMRKNGEYVIEIMAPEGKRLAVLFTYAEGSSSEEIEKCALYGKVVAKMHLAMDGFLSEHSRFNIDVDHLLTEPLHPIKRVFKHRPQDIQYLDSISMILKNRIDEISIELEWGGLSWRFAWLQRTFSRGFLNSF